ncbi:MAG: DNA cytosine methyltransferase [Symbiobacteriia bacterium]
MIDLFSGAGGLSLGLESAGFTSLMAVEINKDACETYRSLFPRSNLFDGSIETVDFRLFEGQVDLVAGGPPCQPFSSGGKRLANKDTRDMLPQFLRAISEIKPPLFLMENVAGLTQAARRPYFAAFINELELLGYRVTWKVLNAADYGVPQKRLRLFIVGSRVGTFIFPKPTHGPNGERPYVPAGSILRRDKAVGDPNASRVFYAKNPDLRPSPYDGHLFNGGGRPINLDVPSPTILASAGGNKTHFIDTLGEVPHYHAELVKSMPPRTGTLAGARRLTVYESALLQTFPPGARFAGPRSAQYKQIGNAVPPLLGRALGHALNEFLSATLHELTAD